ncbi:hypothetical protein [uncultured Deinococcus sp.]|uniref:hypothetical protein n=1 Tax=uncultured Deinococcus sp. TaxID=158789 RepID=UPI00258D6B3A|nr:hypothetical protein [uncultured Deinococcus sp.]
MYRSLTCVALLCSAALAAPPPVPTGEWLTGPALPAAVYEEDFAGAGASGTRLLLRPDGRYARTELDFSYTPGYFGSYIITCGTLNVRVETGRYAVSGDRLSFQPEQAREVNGLSPYALNSGCKRSEGIASVTRPAPYRATYALSGTQLAVNFSGGRQIYSPRPAQSADEGAAASRSVPVGGLGAPGTPAVQSAAPRAASLPTAPLVTPEPYTATGTWQARLQVQALEVTLEFKLYDDGERSLSGSGFVGSQYVAWVLGSRTGTFDLGLDVDGTELKLKVEGRFTGDRYEGTFRAVDGSGGDLGGGTLTMSRDRR